MFTGKTAKALEEYPSYTYYAPKFANRGYLSRDPYIENKFGMGKRKVILHDGIFEINENMIIDEAQFLSEIMIDEITNCKKDIHIVIVGLSSKGVVRGEKIVWHNMAVLHAYADEKHFLKTTCSWCHKPESGITHLKIDGSNIGSDNYRVICKNCWDEYRKYNESIMREYNLEKDKNRYIY